MTTVSRPDLAGLAALLASEARASILWLLMDGRAWTPTELAKATKISRPTATDHLHRLVDAGLLAEFRQGRHRYVRLDNPNVAEMLESLAAFTTSISPAERNFHAQKADQELREARTCYKHLAGRQGVVLAKEMHRRGYLDANWILTSAGLAWFNYLEVELPNNSRRAFTRPCLDWTERRDHLGGTAAEALLKTFELKKWIELSDTTRAAYLTNSGRTALSFLAPTAENTGSCDS